MPGQPQITIEPCPGDDPWKFLRDEAGSIRVETSAEHLAQQVLYIATRRKAAPLADLFEVMRRDMKIVMTVELIVDRRDPSRNVCFDRRHPDRRQHRELNALARNGWARIVVGQSPGVIAVPADAPWSPDPSATHQTGPPVSR